MLKKILLGVSIIALAACGGGDSKEEDKNQNNTNPKISSDYTTIYMKENSTLSIPLNVENKEEENLFFEIEAPNYVNATVNASNNLIINTTEISSNAKGVITVVVTDSANLNDDIKFNINVEDIKDENEQLSIKLSQSTLKVHNPRDNYEITYTIPFEIISNSTNIQTNLYIKLEEESKERNPYLKYKISDEKSIIEISSRIIPDSESWQDFVANGHETTTLVIEARNEFNKVEREIEVTTLDLSGNNINDLLSKIESELSEGFDINTEEDEALLNYVLEIAENKEIIKIPEKYILKKEIENLKQIKERETTGNSEISFIKNGGIIDGNPILGIEALIELFENKDITKEEVISSLNKMDINKKLEELSELKVKKERIIGKIYEEKLEDFLTRLSINLPEINLEKRFVYNGNSSPFIGNSNYGYIEENIWIPYNQYSFLGGILSKHHKKVTFTLKTEDNGE